MSIDFEIAQTGVQEALNSNGIMADEDGFSGDYKIMMLEDVANPYVKKIGWTKQGEERKLVDDSDCHFMQVIVKRLHSSGKYKVLSTYLDQNELSSRTHAPTIVPLIVFDFKRILHLEKISEDVSAGLISLNEGRLSLGLSPLPDTI